MELDEQAEAVQSRDRLGELLEAFRAFMGAQLVGVTGTRPHEPSTAVGAAKADEALRAATFAAAEQAAVPGASASPRDTANESVTVTTSPTGHRLLASPIQVAEDRSGGLCVAFPAEGVPEAPYAQSAICMLRRVVELAWASDTPQAVERRQLDELVTSVASRLMPVRRETVEAATADTLARLHSFFGVDTVFLRRNDHARGVTMLIDEYPRRTNVPDPDPLGEVSFDADPVFASIRDLREPFVARPSDNEEYQQRVRAASGIDQVSLAMVPLVSDRTEGVLGLIRFGDRVWSEDETSALQAIASMLTQLWGRVAAENELHNQAWFDQLTGLSNRHALFAELDRRRTETHGALGVVFLDVDNHKDVNDVLGHQIGDRLLTTVAARLRTASRQGDFAARMGGDEFVVLLAGPTDEMEAYAAAERLVRVASQPITIAGNELRRTLSAGVVVTSDSTSTADELLGQADAALYQAKALGHNHVVVFDEPLRAAARERFGTEVLLRRAIGQDQLELHYQPEIDLRTGRLLALEALVRWRHPSQGLLSAEAFVGVAERTGMILDLGEWVLEEAARQATEWLRRMPELDIAVRVNVSPLQLRDRGVATAVSAALSGRPLHRRLTLEITEHAVMQDVDKARSLLHELRDLGVGIALDDFGTGYSSLAQLKRLPLAYLKVDRALVADLGDQPGDRSMLDAVARLATAFDLELIAEGVETPAHIDHLLAIGCHRAQGFLLARPMTTERLQPLLTAGAVDLTKIRGQAAVAGPVDADASQGRSVEAPCPDSPSSGGR